MPTSLTACQQSPEFYLFPEKHGGDTLCYAATRCHTCPLLRDCAQQALTAGNSLDGHRHRPATGVIQAGVHCKGDQDTAHALATIAGIPAPPQYRDAPKRNRVASHCVSCQRPMVKWSRNGAPLPEGVVAHHGRNFCKECRPAYTKHLEQLKETAPEKVRRTRPVDRHRHHQITSWRHPRTGEPGTVEIPRRTAP